MTTSRLPSPGTLFCPNPCFRGYSVRWQARSLTRVETGFNSPTLTTPPLAAIRASTSHPHVTSYLHVPGPEAWRFFFNALKGRWKRVAALLLAGVGDVCFSLRP